MKANFKPGDRVIVTKTVHLVKAGRWGTIKFCPSGSSDDLYLVESAPSFWANEEMLSLMKARVTIQPNGELLVSYPGRKPVAMLPGRVSATLALAHYVARHPKILEIVECKV